MTGDDKKILLDSLWKMYLENTSHGRHLETQRSTVSNLILILVGAILTLITIDKHINYADLPALVLLLGVGIFGAIFSAKHYLTYRNHMECAKYYRIAIDELLPSLNDPDLAEIRKHIDVQNSAWVLTELKQTADNVFEKYPRNKFLTSISHTRIHWLWITLFILIIVIAIFLGVVSLAYNWVWV